MTIQEGPGIISHSPPRTPRLSINSQNHYWTIPTIYPVSNEMMIQVFVKARINGSPGVLIDVR
jgi:hypothetical protein